MSDIKSEHPQYWALPFCAHDEFFQSRIEDGSDKDDPHALERCLKAQVRDIIDMKRPDKTAPYASHIFSFRVTVDDIAANPELSLIDSNTWKPERYKGDYTHYGACYIVGELPESLTSKRDFKELTWPTINPQ